MKSAMATRWQRFLTVALIVLVIGLVGGIVWIRATTPRDPCPGSPGIVLDEPGKTCPLIGSPTS
jgi:uncharacterized membrane protein